MHVKKLCISSILLLVFSVPQIYQSLHSYHHHHHHACEARVIKLAVEQVTNSDESCELCDYTFATPQPFHAPIFAFNANLNVVIKTIVLTGTINNAPFLIDDARAPPVTV